MSVAVAPVTGRQGYLLLLEGCQAPRQVVLHHLSELQDPALSCITVSHRAPLSSPLVLVSNRVVGEDRLTFVSLSSERVVLGWCSEVRASPSLSHTSSRHLTARTQPGEEVASTFTCTRQRPTYSRRGRRGVVYPAGLPSPGPSVRTRQRQPP